MRAISITKENLEKIKNDISDEEWIRFERWYSTLTLDPSGQHQALYLVSSGDCDRFFHHIMMEDRFFSDFILVTSEGGWSNYPNDWFEIMPRPGMEVYF
jgi:hypothetical protein